MQEVILATTIIMMSVFIGIQIVAIATNNSIPRLFEDFL